MNPSPNFFNRPHLADRLTAATAKQLGLTRNMSETLPDFMNRVIEAYPSLTTENCDRYRELITLLGGRDHKHSEERLSQMADHLMAIRVDLTVHPIRGDRLYKLIGGDRKHMTKFVRAYCSNEIVETSTFGFLNTALGHAPCSKVQPLIVIGLVELVTGAGALPLLAMPTDQPLEWLRDKMDNLAPKLFSLAWLANYNKSRRMLHYKNWETHSAAVINAAIDFFIAHGQRAGAFEVWQLLHGDFEQIYQVLKRRYLAGDNVLPPVRKTFGRGADLLALAESLPPELQDLPHTPLDHVGGTSTTNLNASEISHILGLDDQRFLVIAAVVGLYGGTRSEHRYDYKRGLASITHLAPAFQEIDPTLPGDVQAAITAQEIIADGLPRDYQRVAYQNLIGWDIAVSIYENYLKRDLPTPLRTFLEAHRPTMPVMRAEILGRLQKKSWALTDENYRARVLDIDDFLQGAPSLPTRIMRRREISQDLHRQVHQLVDDSLSDLVDERMLDITKSFEILSESDGKTINVKLRIRHWDQLIAELAETGRHGKMVSKLEEGYREKLDDWDRRFETRFAIQYLGTTDGVGAATSPPYWIDFHVDRLFWSIRSLNDKDFAQALARLETYKFNLRTCDGNASGLGNFSRARGRLSNAIRGRLGYILLPIDENDHAEAYAVWNVMMRLDTPARSGELGQFNLDEGLQGSLDEDGESFTVFSALRKNDPQIHDFVPSPLSERLAEELLTITSERKLNGGPILPVARPARIAKGPETAAFVISYGAKSLSMQQLSVATAMFLAGICKVRPHDHKYLWNRLQTLAGKEIAELQADQGHKRPQTTFIYNPPTKADRHATREMIHDFLAKRREVMRLGANDSFDQGERIGA